MAKNSAVGTICKVLAFLIVLAAIAVGVLFILKYTLGGTSDFVTFYLEHDGKQFMTEKNELTLIAGKEERFDVKYTFDFINNEPQDYSVQIVPNTEKDFSFTLNDTHQLIWSGEKDLSPAFELHKEADHFTITPPASIKAALQALYPDDEIGYDEELPQNDAYYKLTVTSYNGKAVRTVTFDVIDVWVQLDQHQLYFGNR